MTWRFACFSAETSATSSQAACTIYTTLCHTVSLHQLPCMALLCSACQEAPQMLMCALTETQQYPRTFLTGIPFVEAYAV